MKFHSKSYCTKVICNPCLKLKGRNDNYIKWMYRLVVLSTLEQSSNSYDNIHKQEMEYYLEQSLVLNSKFGFSLLLKSFSVEKYHRFFSYIIVSISFS